MLNLSMLHDYYPALERFKHAWTKHVVWIACFSATSPIPARPPGLMSLCKNERGSITGVAVLSVDGTFPPEVREDRDLSRRLLIEDTSPKDPSRLTRRRFRQVVLSMENCPHLWMEPVDVFPQFEPSDFKGDELMQLLHVHFRLSHGLPALVETFSDELAHLLASMLRLKFEECNPENVRGSLALLPLARSPPETIWARVETAQREAAVNGLPWPGRFIFLLTP
ncbi:unnamed protein product [Effrenium voratum]|uniref:Uncharacterized protein n=1 Tax=Effrenium voratum TaxID=2562239 RepID=A0AA36IYX2_9DINO|nr:unnamed protein product [Effrenium voratum]